jgi:hypothetical protein
MFGLSGGASDTVFTGFRQSTHRAEAVAGNPCDRLHLKTPSLQKCHFKKDVIYYPGRRMSSRLIKFDCQAARLLIFKAFVTHPVRPRRTPANRRILRCLPLPVLIGFFRKRHLPSICGKLKNRSNQIRDIFHGGPQ